jgi:hypothetical protein
VRVTRPLALFASGLFFGGAVDHVVLLVLNSPQSAWGFRVGIGGNAALAALDFTLAGALFAFYWRLGRR